MRSTATSCDAPGCRAGPCQLAANWVIAEAGEVPAACPNLHSLIDAPVEVPALLRMADEPHLTPRAAQLVSLVPRGGGEQRLRELLTGGTLRLLETRIRRPLQRGPVGAKVAPPLPQPPEPPTPPALSWIEFQLIDKQGRPVSGEKYRVTLTDGTIKEGVLGGSGKVRFDDIPAGTCRIQFPRLDIYEPTQGGAGAAPATA